LFLSPLLASLRERCAGFTHLTSMLLTINWNSNVNRMFCFFNNNQGSLTSTTSSWTLSSPTLRCCQYLDPLMIPPAVVTYPWNDASRYTTFFTLPADSTITSVTSQNIQMDRIPKYMALLGHKDWNSFTFQDSNSFIPIYNVSINFNGVTYLSSCSQDQLYKYSVQNGVQMNWLQWYGNAQIGSSAVNPTMQVETLGPICLLKFGEQIPLPPQWSIGTSVKVNCQATVQFYNNDVQAIATMNSYLYMVLIYDSAISLFGANSGSLTNAPITEIDCLKAQKESPNIHYAELNNHGFGASQACGGSNFITSGKLRSFIEHARRLLQELKPIVQAGVSLAKYGMKKSGNKTLSGVADAIQSAGFGDVGGAYIGGRQMTKAQLKQAMLQ